MITISFLEYKVRISSKCSVILELLLVIVKIAGLCAYRYWYTPITDTLLTVTAPMVAGQCPVIWKTSNESNYATPADSSCTWTAIEVYRIKLNVYNLTRFRECGESKSFTHKQDGWNITVRLSQCSGEVKEPAKCTVGSGSTSLVQVGEIESTTEAQINNTASLPQLQRSFPYAGIIGGVVGGLIVFIVVLAIIAFRCKRNKEEDRRSADDTRQTNDNPLYDEAARPDLVTSHEEAQNEYDLADDSRSPPVTDTYAQVVRTDPQGGDVYAVVQKGAAGKKTQRG